MVQGLMQAPETTVTNWLTLIQAEYRELPGLSLSKRQIQRLWGLDQVTCDALVDALQEARFLRCTASNLYVLDRPDY